MRRPTYCTWIRRLCPNRFVPNRHDGLLIIVMDTRQIMCSLRSVGSFLGVFPSDLLPQLPIAWSGTLIVNTDPHTESGSHCLAIHVQPRSHSSFYFDSYGLPPFIPPIESFLHRNNIVQNYKAVHLQGPTNTVCDKYCCLFALYMDRGYTPRQFIGLLPTASTDRVVADMFASAFGPLRGLCRGGQCCGSRSTRCV